MQPRLALTAFALLAVTAGCELDAWADSHRVTEDFQFRHDLTAGGRLTVENFNGSVEIDGWNQNYVEITGQKYAPTKEQLDRLKVQVTPSADFIQIRTVRDAGSKRWGNMGARYRIRVPARTRLDGITSSNGQIKITGVDEVGRVRTSNGRVSVLASRGNADVDTSNGPVEIRDFSGPANVRTSNGPVTVSGVSGRLEIVTSNGPVRAEVGETDGPVRLRSSNGPVTLELAGNHFADVTASTSNGPVTVKLPESANGRVKAHTSNSSITCDLPNARIESKSKSSLNATFGSGGPLLDLATSNGRIRLEGR